MSWSTYTVGLPTDIDARIDALEPPGEGTTEREEQVKAAKEAAKALLASGAVGAGEAFIVSLNGHANPEHKPAQGSGSDTVSAGISQTNAAAVETYDAQQKAALAAEQ